MRIARFPGAGVAGAPLALVVLLSGCSDLTSPPPVSLDAGRDLSTEARAVGGSDGQAVGTYDGSPALTDLAVNPGMDSQGPAPDAYRLVDTGGFGGSGGMGGTGGTGGAGGAGGTDAYNQPSDGSVAIDGPQIIDSTPESDAGLAIADGSSGADRYVTDATPGNDTRPDSTIATLTVNAGADKTVCSGFSVLLSPGVQGGVPPYTYAWTAAPTCTDCIASPTLVQTTVSPDVTTTFTITVKDSLGATASDSLVVTVPTPIADAGNETVTINAGESVDLGTAGRAGYTYAWTCDRPTCSLSAAKVAQPTVKPSLSTMYTLTATSPEGCVATDSATVWINLPVSTSPANGATYPRTGSLFVQFGAPVLASSLSNTTIILRETDSEKAVGFDKSYDAASRILTITPKGANYNATIGDYTLILKGGAEGILSSDSVRPQRLPGDVVVNYTISGAADTTGPTIESRSPASGAVGVPTNAGVSAVWSEPLDPTTVNVTSFAVWNGMTAVPGTVTYNPESFTVTFVPTTTFAASTSYTVWATGIQDISGNAATSTSWSFTTGTAADTTPPTVTAVVPSAGATKASVASTITVTFNEAVKPASAISGMQVTTGTTSVAGSVEYDSVTRQAVFTPSGLLSKQTSYTVTVSGVQDTAGNTMATAFTSSFTTANVLFSDNFESGTTKWTLTSTWGLTTSVSSSATHSLTDSPTGDYGATTTSATMLTPIDVTGLTSVTLSYWVSGSIAMYDYLRVEYSTGGYGGWTTAANLTGDLGNGMRSHTITLGAYAGTQLQIRFRLIPSMYAFSRADGAYIDDVLVQAN